MLPLTHSFLEPNNLFSGKTIQLK